MTVVNTGLPVVTGIARATQLLSTDDGDWTFDLDHLDFTYRWLRCDAAGANCVAIAGATGAAYRLTAADIGATIRAEVTATESAAPPPPPPPAAGRRWGVNGSKWYDASHNPNLVDGLGAQVVRHEEGISTAATALDTRFASYRNAGIEVLYQAGIGSAVTTAQAQNLGAVATRHGPSGTASILFIEFGNETSYAYQNPGDISGIAANYALRAKEAAISMAGTGVGLLVQADDALRGATWVNSMFGAVPDLSDYVAGWTCHPYGPTAGTSLHDGSPAWRTDDRIDRLIAQLAAHGDTTTPFYFTEFGLATDNGRTLSDNYEWKRNMTYTEAAQALDESEAMWVAKCGARWVFTSYYRDFDNAAPGASTDREAYFGIVKADGSDKGILTDALRDRFAL